MKPTAPVRVRPRRFWRLWLLAGCWLALALAARGAGPSPTPPPDPATLERANAFAKRLIDAPADDARRRLLADAPPDLRDAELLRRRFNFQVGSLINVGEYARAEALLAFTRRWCEERQDRLGVALVDWGLGNSLGYRGNLRESAEYFAAAKRFFVDSGDRQREAGVSTNQSILAYRHGDYREALAGLERALAIHREMKSGLSVAADLEVTGNVYSKQGQVERAIVCWQEALESARGNDDMLGTLFSNLGGARAALGDLPGAIVYGEKALGLARQSKDQAGEAAALTNLALYRDDAGQSERAEKLYREALALGRKIDDKERQAAALTGVAEALSHRPQKPEDNAEALTLARQGAALASETGDSEQIIRGYTILGRLCRNAGQPAEARAALTEAIDALEDARSHLAGGDAEAVSFLEDKLTPYREMVTLLADTGQPAQALAMAERAKARALVEILRSPKLDPAQVVTAAERDAARARASEIAALNRQAAAARAAQPPTPPDQLAALNEKLAAARRARDDAEADFFGAHPELRNRQGPGKAGETLSATALDGLLADGKTALLEYVLSDGETLLFTVTKTGKSPLQVRVQKLPFGRVALTARTRAFRTALAERSLGWQTDARALGDDLLAAAWKDCAGAERWLIVPDGSLWELPFQALLVPPEKPSAPPRTLWETVAVCLAPSLTFLAQLPPAPAAFPPSARLLAVGNPALGNEPPALAGTANSTAAVLMDDETTPLPDAERQVRALAGLYGPERSRVLVGADAGEDQFKRCAGDYEVIHFATHGFLNDTAPMYSRLLMSQRDLAPDEDGFLEAWEWLPLKLRARLAVLSACETGRGRIGDGEGLLGFSWALFSAGCPAVIASQWKVDSASTSDLMIGLHRQLLRGVAPSRALRMASLDLAKNPRYRHPFYWAPFVLIGAEQPLVSPPP